MIYFKTYAQSGQNPTEADLAEIVRDAEAANKLNIDFPEVSHTSHLFSPINYRDLLVLNSDRSSNEKCSE